MNYHARLCTDNAAATADAFWNNDVYQTYTQ